MKQDRTAYYREYHVLNRPKELAYSREYYKAHPRQQQEWVEKNKERYLEIKRKSDTKRRANPTIKVNTTPKNLVYRALKTNGISYKWPKFFDYSIEELRTHIEKQFTKEMSWSNYGTYWHIDHIIPLFSYTYTSKDDPKFKECWSLSNLRPLEAKRNIKKRALFEVSEDNYIHFVSFRE